MIFSCGEKNTEKYDNKVGSEKNKTNTKAAADLCECIHDMITGGGVLKTRKEQDACDQIVSIALGAKSIDEINEAEEDAYNYKLLEILKNCDLLYLIDNDETVEKTNPGEKKSSNTASYPEGHPLKQ